MNFNQKLISAAVAGSTLAGSAFADGPTAGSLAALTPDVATVLTAIGAVGAVMLGVKLAIVGYRKVSSLFR